MSSEFVLSHKQDSILTLTLNRAEKKNALTTSMYTDMVNALNDAKDDTNIKVVLIRGHEMAFTAGNDLNDFNSRDFNKKSPAICFLEALHTFEKPIVAAVSGVAVGIGSTMLLHCDLVYAAPKTRFRMPFINLGLVPEGGSSLLVPMRIGHQRASRLLMLGEFFNSRDAFEAGIVSQQVALESLFEHAKQAALRLAKLPQPALIATKKLMKQELACQISDTINREAQVFGQMLQTPESQKLRNNTL